MTQRFRLACACLALTFVAVVQGSGLNPWTGTVSAAPVERTIYVTATDARGAAVPDLSLQDLVVKEGGKVRTVTKAARAAARIHLALMVEERLTADGPVRQGLYDFMKRMQPTAEIALMTIGLRTATVVDYTNNLDVLVTALNQFSRNPQPTSNVMEGILSVSGQLERQKAERPVMITVSASGGPLEGGNPQQVLGQLRQSGATFNAVALSGGDNQDREKVLLDGAKQSGGRRVDIPGTTNTGKALQMIADDLAAQYVVTYELPEGVKRDQRLSVSTTRHGVTLRAPSAIPDR